MFRAPLLVAGTPEISLLVNFYHITALIIMKSVLNILLASYASVTAAVSLAEAASALEARTIGQICDTPYVSINPLWLPRSLSLFFSPFYLTTPLPQGSGTCQTTATCHSWLDLSVPDYCPGPTDVQCCLDIECDTPSGYGWCMNTDDGSCPNGRYIS